MVKKLTGKDKDFICSYCMNVFDSDPIEDFEGNYFCGKPCKNDFAKERREELKGDMD